jgi:hypothetical protein
MNVISKRNTLHLTSGKYYKVLEKIYIKNKLHRVIIISDVESMIESSINNFYTLEETREFKIKKLLDGI